MNEFIRTRVQIRGAKQLRRTLKKAGVDVKQLKSINREAAQIATTAAVASAPIGGPYKKAGRGRPRQGGRLKASGRAFATQRAGVIRFGSAGVPYAGPIHWGWPAKNIRAQPFAAEAAQRTEPVWTKAYERKMHEVINSVKVA